MNNLTENGPPPPEDGSLPPEEESLPPVEGSLPPEGESLPEEKIPQDLRISPQDVDGNYRKFEGTSKEELILVLRGLLRNGTPITAYLDDSQEFLLTALLGVDEENNKLALALDSNKNLNRRAQLCSKLICLSTQGKIKIQFILERISLARFGEGNAFQGDIPATLIRLQRRDYYRLTVPKGNPLICTIPIPQADGSTLNHELGIVNISGRGLTLLVPPEGIEFTLNQELPKCSIELPAGDKVVATLQVRSIYYVDMRGGRTSKRAGCQFLKLPGPMQHLLLRYILKVESERLASKM